MPLRLIVATILLALSAAPPLSALAASPLTIVFFGDSLTAGYRLAPEQSYPAVVQQKADASGYRIQAINAGVSGDTTADGLARLDWSLPEHVDVFFLALGVNDGLRGLDLDAARQNLAEIIRRVRLRFPAASIVIAGMELPVNFGTSYRDRFRKIFPALASEEHSPLLPFLLEGVAGNAELNLDDGIHPNVQGQQIVAATVWKFLQPLMPAAVTPSGDSRERK